MIGIGVFYLLCAWGFIAHFGSEKVTAAAEAETANLFSNVLTDFMGPFASDSDYRAGIHLRVRARHSERRRPLLLLSGSGRRHSEDVRKSTSETEFPIRCGDRDWNLMDCADCDSGNHLRI